MTIEQAVETLNRAKWRGRDDWQVNPMQHPGCLLSIASMPVATGANDPKPPWSIVNEDAIAIAELIELREAATSSLNCLSGIVRLIESEMGNEAAKRWGRVDLHGIVAEIYGRLAAPMQLLGTAALAQSDGERGGKG